MGTSPVSSNDLSATCVTKTTENIGDRKREKSVRVHCTVPCQGWSSYRGRGHDFAEVKQWRLRTDSQSKAAPCCRCCHRTIRWPSSSTHLSFAISPASVIGPVHNRHDFERLLDHSKSLTLALGITWPLGNMQYWHLPVEVPMNTWA